jgi:hypothetical protein
MNNANPLLDFSDLPLFDRIRPEHVAPAIPPPPPPPPPPPTPPPPPPPSPPTPPPRWTR